MADLFSIAGKVALVTGGSSGIGWMIAEGYACAGTKVYIASRKRDELEARIAELGDAGEVLAVVADFSTEAGCNALGEEIESREDRLEILVNNAGAKWGAPYAEFPESGWDRVLDPDYGQRCRARPLPESSDACDPGAGRSCDHGDGLGFNSTPCSSNSIPLSWSPFKRLKLPRSA